MGDASDRGQLARYVSCPHAVLGIVYSLSWMSRELVSSSSLSVLWLSMLVVGRPLKLPILKESTSSNLHARYINIQFLVVGKQRRIYGL
jgi:hypothetical protein